MLLDINGNKIVYNNAITVIDVDLAHKKEIIESWLGGAIWGYSKNGEEFQIRDIVGGENFYWDSTPLDEIFYAIRENCSSDDEAIDKAGQTVGKIAKRIICNSKHEYQQLQGRGKFNSNVYKRI